MTHSTLVTILSTTPFRPFSLRLADGRKLPVTHRQAMAVRPTGRIAVVVDDRDGFEVIDLGMVAGVEFASEDETHVNPHAAARITDADAASELAAFSDPTTLGDHLDFALFMASSRQARERLGLTISEVAERMGVDHAAVSRLESGKQSNPTVNTVMRYVEAIGLRVAWGLAERDDAPVPRGQRPSR